MTRSLAAVLTALATAACATAGPKPDLRQRTDQLIAEAQAKPKRDVGENAGGFVARPWTVGQWVLVKNRIKGEPSVLKMSIVGKEARGIWLESETWDYRQHAITKMLYARQPVRPEEALDAVLVVVTQSEGEPPQTMDFSDPRNPMAGMMKGMMKGMLKDTSPDPARLAGRETVTVPAGTFRGCAAYAAKGPDGKDHKGHVHPAVPVNGIVKAESIDGDTAVELLDYGETGATSAIR